MVNGYGRGELAKKIIIALSHGAVLLTLILVPNSGRMLGIFGENTFSKNTKYNKNQRIKRALERLKKKQILQIYERDNNTIVELTDSGIKKLHDLQLENIHINKPKRWDERWRLIMFDIPESRHATRKAFIRKLRELNFFCFQKSIWAFPYPCREEIDFIAEMFDIKDCINYIETRFIDDDTRLISYFFNK